MPFPCLPPALAFIGGILAADSAPWPPALAVAATLFPLAAAWYFYAVRKNRAAHAWALLAAVALGGAFYSDAEARYSRHPLHRLPTYTYADFRGTVIRSLSPGMDRDELLIRVSEVRSAGAALRLDGRVRVAIAHSVVSVPRPDVLPGDEVLISAQIVPPKEYRNFGEPFARRYLRTQSVHALAATKSPRLVERIRPGSPLSPLRMIARVRRAFLRRIETAFASSGAPGGISREGAVFEALVLGERGRVDPDINRTLQETGLLHLLAISGAHIGIIAALLFAALKASGVPQRPASALLIALLIGYALLVEGQASVTRAVVMAVLYFSGRLLWKDVHLLNTLALSAVLILVDNPFQLFDMGFALTYAATFFILLFYERILRRLPRLPFKMSETLAMSLSAQAGVLPLIAGAFHRVTFSGLALNFIAIPIVSLMLAVGYLYLPLSFLSGIIAAAGASLLRLLSDAFLASTHLLDGFPGLSYRVPTPPLWVSVGTTAALLLLLVPGRDRAQKAMTAAAAGGFVLLLVLCPFSARSPYLRLTFLDVGHGDSILVEFPGTETMLIDGGGLPVGTFDIGENVVSPFLWAKGLRAIHTMVLTHPHPDHRNGLAALARNFRPREFWEAAPAAEDAGALLLRKALGSAIRRTPEPGFRRVFAGVGVEVLAPDATAPARPGGENDRSLVLRLTYGAVSFLLPGDVEASAERRVLETGRDLRSTVLKSPHHGSRTSSSEEFLRAVSPKVVVVSVGRDNRYGLPDAEVVGRYARRGILIFRTDRDGAVEIVTDGVRLAVRTAASGRSAD